MKYIMKFHTLILTFLISLFLSETNAQILLPNIVLSENIIESDCFINPPNQSWSIAFQKSKEINLSPYQNPVVGDIDGIVEILLCADAKCRDCN